MKLRIVVTLLLLAGLASRAGGQTTQPAAWASVVQQFAASLADPNGADDCKKDLSDDCTVRSFKDPANTLATLAAHTGGANLLLAKAYAAPVTTLASDVASAIDSTRVVPGSIKKLFVPPDVDLAKADSVASQWISRVLNLSAGQSAGVLIYLTADPAHPDSSQPQAMLVLLKGQPDSDGNYHITQIVFGDPQQAIEAYH